ncbi:tetratricopeptide repeat protein 19, mitochondrial isoform X1 [Ascaphus truei]|uniref:tetratricopeptide repeat protein 19, mitochondrial isoform X1 n=2 Tax=Ascaphus truei TaxID=8439 RepID=UPI003F59D305
MFLCRMRSLCRSGPRSLSCVIKGTGILRAIQTAPCREAAACHLTPPSLTSGRQRRSQHRRRSPFLLLTAAAFSLFSTFADKDQGEDLTDSEENLIYLLKKAKLSIMKGEMEEAEEILHQALHLAQQSDSKRGIIYTYDLMANLAILRGQLDSSEKLFKATLVFMLDGGVKQDHISFIEISLKLASIYAAQNQNKLAVAGYQFCIMTLEEKIEKEKDLPVEILAALTAEEKSNTRLLLGLCLDSYGRYLLANAQYSQAQSMYEKALQICKEEQGELHPQTVTLMNDLATVLEAQGHHDEAYAFVKQASELARKTEHPDQHVVLSNMALILMYQGTEHFADVERIFKEALTQAEKKGDSASIRNIQEGLSELERRKKGF